MAESKVTDEALRAARTLGLNSSQAAVKLDLSERQVRRRWAALPEEEPAPAIDTGNDATPGELVSLALGCIAARLRGSAPKGAASITDAMQVIAHFEPRAVAEAEEQARLERAAQPTLVERMKSALASGKRSPARELPPSVAAMLAKRPKQFTPEEYARLRPSAGDVH